jgi:hypothetical protein
MRLKARVVFQIIACFVFCVLLHNGMMHGAVYKPEHTLLLSSSISDQKESQKR